MDINCTYLSIILYALNTTVAPFEYEATPLFNEKSQRLSF